MKHCVKKIRRFRIREKHVMNSLLDWQDDEEETEEEENYNSEKNSKSKERHLILDPDLEVTLTLVPSYCWGTTNYRLELEGIPPIAAEALLEYIYKDS